MNKEQLRLELLKLVYRHGVSTAEAVTMAKNLEQYVLAEDKAATPTPAKKGAKENRPENPFS